MSAVALSDPLNDGTHSNIHTGHMLSSETALAAELDTEDHVMTILHSESLQYQDVEALVVGLNPQRSQDILMSYRILSTLTQYLEETNSWTFCLLNNYDFQTHVRQFDLDVAIVVGKRAEHLLAEIYAWNIPRLKKMVSSFSAYYSDEATILTVIIFRIVSKYSDLEFTLQLALSRATLIKIHYEMTGLFSKLPGENETNTKNGKQHADLVSAYRQFVTQLLSEIESSPFESVQQELFQVVRDLSSMFSKFSDSQMFKSLEGPEYDSFYDNPQAPPVPSSSRLPPLAENDYPEVNSSAPYPKPNHNSQNNHRRTFSNSTMFSATTAASARTTISEELPAMMQAFEAAKKREEYTKMHSTPPETPIRATGGFNGNHKSPTSPSSSQSVMSSPTSTTSTTNIRSQNQPWSSASTVSHSRKSVSPPSVAGSLGSAMVVKPQEPPAEGNMQVKMISNRMMILVDGKYIDMQEWAEKVNSNTQPHHMPMPIPTIHGPASPAPSVASSTAPGAAGAPANFGLATLFQPWLRPAVTNKPIVIDDPSSDNNKQQLVVKKDKRLAKAQSIDNILAKQNGNKPTSTLDLLRSSSMPVKTNNTTAPTLNGFAAANRIPGGKLGVPAAATTTASGFPAVGATVGAPTAMGGFWIKSMLGKAEDQFEKNYKTNMEF